MEIRSSDVARAFFRGLLAGMCIGIGCCLRLFCENRLIAALPLAMGLCCALLLKGALFPCPSVRALQASLLALILISNLIGALPPSLLSLVDPQLKLAAYRLCVRMLEAGYLACLLNALLCGFLLFFIALGWTRFYSRGPLPTFFCTLMAVTAGFLFNLEHCVANMSYLFMGDMHFRFPLKAAALCAVTAAGNALGARLGCALGACFKHLFYSRASAIDKTYRKKK